MLGIVHPNRNFPSLYITEDSIYTSNNSIICLSCKNIYQLEPYFIEDEKEYSDERLNPSEQELTMEKLSLALRLCSKVDYPIQNFFANLLTYIR